MPDVRPIDANALKEHIVDLPTWWADGGGVYPGSMKYPEGMFDPEDIVNSIDNAPTINPDDLRPHGWWVDIYRLEVKPEWVCRCSLCGCPQDFKHHYCPNCGAKMDGKERCK